MRGVHGTEKVRLIGLLREPGARMWSAYWYWPQYRRRYGQHAKGFLAYVEHVVAAFEACVEASAASDGLASSKMGGAAQRQRWLEDCAFNFESLSAVNEGVYYHADQLLKSLYAAYVPTWLRAFGRPRLLLLRAEDYWAQPKATLNTVSEFLGLGAPAPRHLDAAAAAPLQLIHGSNAPFWGDKRIVNSHMLLLRNETVEPGHVASRIPMPMGRAARLRLSSFFEPHNAALATLLGDERFRWDDVLRRREEREHAS